MNLVAFTGRAGSGKSTAANAVVGKFGFVRISFAYAIRSMLYALGFTKWHFGEGKNTPLDWLDGKTPREIMQTLGTEWGRTLVHPDLWVRLAKRTAENLLAAGARGIVIDDVRFDNEAKIIRELGGLVIGIERPGLSTMSHASEAGVDRALVDFWLQNSPAISEPQFCASVIALVSVNQNS